MQAIRVFLLLTSMLPVALPLYALDDPKVAHAKYDELAAKVNRGDLNIDWQALRLAARVGEVYGDYDPYDAAKRAQASFEKGDFEGALRIAQETERHNVADGDADVAAWSCLKTLGRQREADKGTRSGAFCRRCCNQSSNRVMARVLRRRGSPSGFEKSISSWRRLCRCRSKNSAV